MNSVEQWRYFRYFPSQVKKVPVQLWILHKSIESEVTQCVGKGNSQPLNHPVATSLPPLLRLLLFPFFKVMPNMYSMVKNPAADATANPKAGLISGLGRSPGEGNGDSLKYSCLENSMDRGAWRAPVHGVTKSQTHVNNWECVHVPCARCQEKQIKLPFFEKFIAKQLCLLNSKTKQTDTKPQNKKLNYFCFSRFFECV